ncbi:MAG TPA: heavy metal-associated domain-containing protein [Desulfuromonadaceae bacterium]
MNAKIINGTLILAAAVLLTVFAVHVRAGVTADAVAILKTAGMTCGSCAGNVSKTLQRVKGVAATEVDVAAGQVVVAYDTKAVKPETLAENVTRSGFDSRVQEVMTPERFRQVTGRDMGRTAASSGCCGGCATQHAKEQK